MTVSEYLQSLSRRYKIGNSTEHTFRADLQSLLESLDSRVIVTNEPTRIDCGAPDYILTRQGVPVGYIEAKDLGENLDNENFTEQFGRYRRALANLLITNYLEFRLYFNGEFQTSVSIGEIKKGKIVFLPEKFEQFSDIIKHFCHYSGTTIKTSFQLAELMAGKARLLEHVIENALNGDEEQQKKSELRDQLSAFRQILMPDITPRAFADIYAQTVAYGMFAARFHDPGLKSFSRAEAAELIPRSNPFLRKLFGYIAGPDLDDRIRWIVEGLVELFRASDVKMLLREYGSTGLHNDPMLHFYEDFLAKYDPKLRKRRGVWYTPLPIVRFMVNAVDDILKNEFDLAEGLADRSKIATKNTRQNIHRVQILDPATGTGTFLGEVVHKVRAVLQGNKEGNKGGWGNYVEEHLIPRLNGFEILMASYSMTHLKLEIILNESGFRAKTDQRLNVFLTNSLEEHHPDTGTLFAQWLSEEANGANRIKRDNPVMVVIGNPPYSAVSENNGAWITSLIEDYKYVDGVHFGERKHWLQDDYVKFIRLGEHFIEKTGEGILAFINNHAFLDNPTFRGMRSHLLKTFDSLYILDLHGNRNKKETAPDGSGDQNVFNIQQGVSINLFVKTGKKQEGTLGVVHHAELWGSRDSKFDVLLRNDLKEIRFKKIEAAKPDYYFVPKKNKNKIYERGFSLDQLFPNNKTGIVTMGDSFVVANTKEELMERLQNFLSGDVSESELTEKYHLGKNYARWILENKRNKTLQIDISKIIPYEYRPFDTRWTIFDNQWIWRWRYETMRHFFGHENWGLVFSRQSTNSEWTSIQVTKSMIDNRYHFSNKGIPLLAPLYLYSDNRGQEAFGEMSERTPNLNTAIIGRMANITGLRFTPEKEKIRKTFAPIDILDYVYGVLCNSGYRKKYNEYLKIDFPRVSYPKDAEEFWSIAKVGGRLRQLHLLESPQLAKSPIPFPMPGNSRVDKVVYDGEKIWINEKQYFSKISADIWHYTIGGYVAVQKWLKDRINTTLSFNEIEHYRKILFAVKLTEQ